MDHKKLLGRFTKSGGKVTDLSRIGALLAKLGDPQNSLKFVHIAGTNGKGSVSHMIAAALTSAGYRTGLFTSPFILRYNDRITIDGSQITDEQLDLLADKADRALSEIPYSDFSQFEITQALAFMYYAQKNCDIVVLETGLGGLLDSTNIIEPPLVSVITSIDFDHTAILGGSLEDIAAHKAGIIKPDSRAVMAACLPESAMRVIRKKADECKTPLIQPDISSLEIISSSVFGSDIRYRGEEYFVGMGGRHQIINALTALETMRILQSCGFDISRKDALCGLKVRILARVHIAKKDPLVIIDGSHNPQGVRALADSLDSISCLKTAVIGMLADKDCRSCAEIIAPHCERFICVEGFAPNAISAAELSELLKKAGAAAEVSELSAEETIGRELSKDHTLVICGSLYLASKALNTELFRQ